VITPKGRRLLERARGLIGQVEDEVLAGLTADERHQLLALLRRALEAAPAQPVWSSSEGN
jgi:DNA-binding MarR family transcriptional regulator